jgi:PAS domain S-box-containing protein
MEHVVTPIIADRAQKHIQAQAFFISRIMDISPDIIHIVNIRTGTTVYVNKMLLTELGYTPDNIRLQQLEKNFVMLYHPDDVAKVEEFNEAISKAGDDVILELEVRVKAKNNSWQWFKTRAKIFEKDKSGRPEKYIGFSQNITERKQVEEQRKQNAVLAALDKAKTEFFNNISHEFRTPLSLILGPLEDVLKSSTLDPATRHKLEMTQRNAHRLQRLVNTQLDFARIEAGRMDAVFQPTDLCRLTTDVASCFRSLIESGGLRFSLHCDSLSEPLYVCPEMWENILSNLLSNAFKYTLKGKIEVRLYDRQKFVQLQVRDTGLGISSDNLPKIFERFTRVDSTGGRTREGSGIGLALVKELVAIHKGSIKVKSKPGQGSTFIVSIPKGKSHIPSRQIFESKNVGNGSASLSFINQSLGWLQSFPTTQRKSRKRSNKELTDERTKQTILFIDDNLDIRLYLKDLMSQDCIVNTVANAEEALNLLNSGEAVDLVVTDIMLPRIDGLDFLKEMKNNRSLAHIPVIVLSARSDESIKQAALLQGADDFITKPFRSAEIKSRLLMHLMKKRS